MPYSGDPSDSTIDAVRFWLNDVSDPPLLTDMEIEYVISFDPFIADDPLLIAAECAMKLASKYAGQVAITADGVSYSGNQLADKYNQLASTLRTESAQRSTRGAVPVPASDCYIPRNYRIGMFDNPQAGVQGPLPVEYLQWEYDEDPANYQPTPGS